jgi:hypothetical protein
MPFKESSYGGSCEETVQCTSRLGINALWKEGRCDCEVQFRYSPVDGYCIKVYGEKPTLIITVIIIATVTRS